MAKDYYQTLGISKEASEDEIKKAYRKLALKHHPDKATEDKKKEYEQKFKDISEAYRVLSDKNKRSQYDQFGQTFDQGPGANPFGGGFSQQDFSHFYDAFGDKDVFEEMGFDRIFEQMFGFRSQSRGKKVQYGQDISMDLVIDLEEAFSGIKKELEVKTLVPCSKCQGQGGQDFKKCNNCQGSGYVQEVAQSIFGRVLRQKICPDCQGRGEKPAKKCHHCQGQGRVQDIKKIKLDIPAGIDNGQTLKLKGQGEAAPFGGPAGHLYLNIHLKPHKYFKRQTDNLIYQLPISFTQAILGDKIEIPVIGGQVNLKIPAGSQVNDMIELKGKGMPKLYGRGRGNMIVQLLIEIPKKLSPKQKQLLEEFKQTEKKHGFSRFFS